MLDALRYLMPAGVNRVRGFISYVEGKITVKPKMNTEELARKDRSEWQSSPRVDDLIESSRKLSEAILKAELEIQSLEKVSSPAIDVPRTDETLADNQQVAQLSV